MIEPIRFMADCPNNSLLRHTLSNGTQVSFCGLPFNNRKTCGFLEQDSDVGVQLCCTLTEAIGVVEAVCEYTVGQRVGQLMEVMATL